MEDILVYLILAGWGVMLFVPSILIAVVFASVLGVCAAYLVHLNSANSATGFEPDLMNQMMIIAPFAVVAIFAAWPLGAILRWFVNRNKRAGI
ncbi:MAG: hypothetical protein OXQ92_08120 [Boseongicola sp.]|nr:hypothetical protein [Boseongicola sp.]